MSMSSIAYVQCPDCGEIIPIPVVMVMGQDADGHPVVSATPDTGPAWDHYEERHTMTKGDES